MEREWGEGEDRHKEKTGSRLKKEALRQKVIKRKETCVYNKSKEREYKQI